MRRNRLSDGRIVRVAVGCFALAAETSPATPIPISVDRAMCVGKVGGTIKYKDLLVICLSNNKWQGWRLQGWHLPSAYCGSVLGEWKDIAYGSPKVSPDMHIAQLLFIFLFCCSCCQSNGGKGTTRMIVKAKCLEPIN